jgi:hypothetical protein
MTKNLLPFVYHKQLDFSQVALDFGLEIRRGGASVGIEWWGNGTNVPEKDEEFVI